MEIPKVLSPGTVKILPNQLIVVNGAVLRVESVNDWKKKVVLGVVNQQTAEAYLKKLEEDLGRVAKAVEESVKSTKPKKKAKDEPNKSKVQKSEPVTDSKLVEEKV